VGAIVLLLNKVAYICNYLTIQNVCKDLVQLNFIQSIHFKTEYIFAVYLVHNLNVIIISWLQVRDWSISEIILIGCHPKGEKTFHHACCDGDVIVDVLINPRLTTLIDGVGVFLRAPARYRHLVYAGLALAGSGSWIVQDGLFTFKHLTEAAGRTSPELEPEIGRVLVVSAFTEGEWTEDNIHRIIGAPDLVMRLNPGLGKRAELETAEEGIIR